MYIERIQVEEGFLNGLDVSLRSGLNVIIGARGTGKTSLIELIRFCLDVPGYTQDSTRRSRDHALSVLGSGQVTVTLVDGPRRIVVSRSANDTVPRATGPYMAPIVLSQTEIETVGLQAGGRLRLLDGFLGDQRSVFSSEAEAISAVRSLTTEANAVIRDIEQLKVQIEELPSILHQISELAPQEHKLASLSADAAARTQHLNGLTNTLSGKAVAADATARFFSAVADYQAAIGAAQSRITAPEPWPIIAGPDPLSSAKNRLSQVYMTISNALESLGGIMSESGQLTDALRAEKVALEDNARQLRRDIDGLQSGAGEIIRRGQLLRERKAQLDSLQTVLEIRRRVMTEALDRRARSLETLEQVRAYRFHCRVAAAQNLNKILGPRIKIDVSRGGQTETFASAIAEALRGSGLRYNDIVTTLAQRLSPRELVEAVENDDYQLIAKCGAGTLDRAAKVAIALKNVDLGQIATISVEDHVTFSLLDGADYKDIADLSTGQRCTVVLPLVLQHTDRLLVVDQPEDHIDNAFIVDTLIKSILSRSIEGQILFSTHNANIPVLGNADLVVQLGSDGKRGFPLAVEPLGSPRTIHAITTVMEGGADAFRYRAQFYGAQL